MAQQNRQRQGSHRWRKVPYLSRDLVKLGVIIDGRWALNESTKTCASGGLYLKGGGQFQAEAGGGGV